MLLPPTVIPLWPEGNPSGWHIEGPERASAEGHLSNVSAPRLELYRGTDAKASPVIVVPGGGYFLLAADHEGAAVARWCVAQGHPAYVLLHRLPRRDARGAVLPEDAPRERIPLEDLTKALAIVRARHPGRIVSTIGFSAGGHLTAVAAAGKHGPDRLALIYPAYLLEAPAPARAVPVFGAIAEDDDAAWVAGLRGYLRATGGEGRFIPTGGHGYGLRPNGAPAPWLDDLAAFLKD